MTDSNCALCKRPFRDHSRDTADICNSYIGPDRDDDVAPLAKMITSAMSRS